MNANWNETLANMRLKVRESDDPNRYPVDFCIEDLYDNVAWVWGYREDYEVECDHPDIEYGDDDERGRCAVCGETCDWHYEKDVVNEGHDEQGNYACQEAEVRVPDEWHKGDGGIIKQYIEEVYGRQQN